MEAVHLTFAEIEALAEQRRGSSWRSGQIGIPGRVDPLAFGIARMYGQLVRWTPIEVRVFCRLSSAAAWLNATRSRFCSLPGKSGERHARALDLRHPL